MESRRFAFVTLLLLIRLLQLPVPVEPCPSASSDVGLVNGKWNMQVLEILNDKEVWQRQEDGPPKYLGSVKALTEQGNGRSWWQRRSSGQKQQV